MIKSHNLQRIAIMLIVNYQKKKELNYQPRVLFYKLILIVVMKILLRNSKEDLCVLLRRER